MRGLLIPTGWLAALLALDVALAQCADPSSDCPNRDSRVEGTVPPLGGGLLGNLAGGAQTMPSVPDVVPSARKPR